MLSGQPIRVTGGHNHSHPTVQWRRVAPKGDAFLITPPSSQVSIKSIIWPGGHRFIAYPSPFSIMGIFFLCVVCVAECCVVSLARETYRHAMRKALDVIFDQVAFQRSIVDIQKSCEEQYQLRNKVIITTIDVVIASSHAKLFINE